MQHPHADSPWLRELLPLLSQRLCAHLHNEDAQPLPAAYRDMELISVDAWNRTMLLICEGLRPRDALRQAGIGESVFAAHLRYEPRLAAWYARAKQASKRRHWPGLLEVEEVLRDILRNPRMSVRTACRQRGIDYRGFIQRTQTPEFESRFLRSKSLQRDRSFEAMVAELEALGDGVTRATHRSMAQRVHELQRLEPRREWPRKQLSPIEEARQRAKKRRERQSDRLT